jgi:hypothetical protein
MNGTKLAYHGPSNHADARDWQIVREWQPRSMKLMNYQHSSPDLVRDLYGWLPNTLFVMRDWEMSEQLDDMFARPVETGQRHAADWVAWYRVGRFGKPAWKDTPNFDLSRTVCIGINEPTVRGELKRDHPNYAANVQAVVKYTVAFLDALKAAGMKGGALNYSVGWPDNTGPNTRALWDNLEPVREAILRGGHYLVMHEYFGSNGVNENLGWWVGRYRQCPWNVKIIIGEAGFDRAVQGGPHQGFGGVFSTEQYIAHLRGLDNYYKDDPRIHSVQIFLWDYDNNQWHTFALREIREAFLAYVNSVKNTPDTDRVTTFPTFPPGVTNPLPPTGGGGGTMSLTDRLAGALEEEFGAAFEDLRGLLPVHNTRVYSPIDSRGFDYICIHHSATEKTRTWMNIAGYHVNTNGWAGIAYHMGVRRGKFALFDSVDTERAHVYGMNHEALGICVTGNYDTGTVDDVDLDVLKRAVRVIDEVYAQEKVIKGHGELRVGGFTECPGSDLKRLIPSLRPVPPPPPPVPVIDWGKIVWQGEDAVRAEEREGRLDNAQWILTHWVQPAIIERDRV